MSAAILGFLPLAVWLYLLLGRSGFWQMREPMTKQPCRSPYLLKMAAGRRWSRWCPPAMKLM